VLRAAAAVGRDGDCTVSVRVVDEDEMHTLNRNFRDQDKPTNVLSFPAGEIAGLPASEMPILGDIVVCAGVVTREAAEQGKAVADHWGHMIVHGTLHLLGHDHKSAAEAAAMEGLERDILAGLGITDPYRGN
jgi:probable rRNA maturation factor